jgi:outer membrane lipoprotein LolB
VRAVQRLCVWLVATLAIILIAGCATPTRDRAEFPAEKSWQGRLSLKVQTTPAQSFAASFELLGDPQAGVLSFTSPLGNTLARLQWDAHSAQLVTNGAPQNFESLDALTRYTTGAELPVAALFAWLQGQPANAPGWEADLSALPDGRLNARRLLPEVPAELKIILDK